MEIQEVKEYLRVDSDSEDILLNGLMLSAEKYLENAGITKDYTNELYKLAIKLLVSHWYENREIIGKADKLAFNLSAIIIQLKYCQGEII